MLETSIQASAKPVPPEDLDFIRNEVGPEWEQLRGQRIFITGGTGFFGTWLVESFCHANRELGLNARAAILTRNPVNFEKKCPHLAADPAVTLIPGDVRDFTFPEGEYPFVIHAATEASLKQSQEAPMEQLTTILAGTQRTLEFAAARGTKKFLLTSSGAVYGKQPSDLTHLPETYAGAPDPLDPASVYAEGKRNSELMCALFARHSRIECKIARCWAFCGPYLPLDAHFAIGNFINDVLHHRPIQIGGDGTPTRSYLYAADLAVHLWIMLFKAPSMRAYNVGSGESVSIRELAEAVRDTLDPSLEIYIAKQTVVGTPVSRYVPDINRIKGELGLSQTVGLKEMVQRTARWNGWLPEKPHTKSTF